ncbi:unnamed protein product [Lathyrus sativus]|nr:unnamed protein product [Lathyrus sativus]
MSREEEDKCERLQRALSDCHRRVPSGPGQNFACRHLNNAFAVCVVSLACPEESEAVRNLCSSAGTVLKRRQCQQAQISLSLCLDSQSNS